jgi:hypothetical protein
MSDYEDLVNKLASELGLPPARPFTQFWEDQLEDCYSTHEMIMRVLRLLENDERPYREVEILLGLLLNICEDLARKCQLTDAMWEDIEFTLQRHQTAHRGTIAYWLPEVGVPAEDWAHVSHWLVKSGFDKTDS